MIDDIFDQSRFIITTGLIGIRDLNGADFPSDTSPTFWISVILSPPISTWVTTVLVRDECLPGAEGPADSQILDFGNPIPSDTLMGDNGPCQG